MNIFFKIFFTLVIVLLIFPRVALAEEIKFFDVKIEPTLDGKMYITEEIEYDFGESSRHGVYRNIPTVSKVGDLYRVIKVEFKDISRDGDKEKYEVDLENSQVSVKIGDPDKTISGVHKYTIPYVVENGIGSNYLDHDEIYWNVTGNKWEIPIAKARVSLVLESGIKLNQVKCLTGAQGATFENCQQVTSNQVNEIVTSSSLGPYEGLTVVYGFPVNSFPKSTLQKNKPNFDPDFLSFLKIYGVFWGGLNFILAPYLLFWWLKNKRKNRFGKITVNFDLPQDEKRIRITPSEAGTIDNTKLDRSDVVATIFDLAIRKYLKIEEVKGKKFLGIGSGDDYKLVKLKEAEDLTTFEKELMSGLFGSSGEVQLKDLKTSFYQTFQDMEKKVFDSLVKRGFYHKNPKTQQGLLIFSGVVALFGANIFLGLMLIFLSFKLNGRTGIGDLADFKIDGLKLFLSKMTRNYKWQAEQLYVVEKMIPYAMALGYIDKYMEQLKIIEPNYHPTWYSGHTPFNTMGMAMYSSFSSNITTSAPSSSSGFSGGSSGGGGGGGGGGSW